MKKKASSGTETSGSVSTGKADNGGDKNTQKRAKGNVTLKKSRYLADSIAELKKVSFPTREETIKTSIWTVLFVLFFSIILALFDLFFQYLMKMMLV